MYNFYIKIYTIDFKIIEYLTIESKLQLSPIGGANEKEVVIDLFFYGINQSLISYSLLNLLKKDQITSQAFIS
jgi:hypothetical protein